jgi:hypothetical protein
MKSKIFFSLFLSIVCFSAQAQVQEYPLTPKYEYQQITTLESVVPGGLGRSRMIATDKKGQLEETKLENFFSMVGINFGNIKSNDQTITRKIEQMSDEGWELYSVNTGAYSADGGNGIFISRYLFRRFKK